RPNRMLLPFALLPLNALAATLTVDLTSIDAVDANPGDGVCRIAGVAPADPGCTLRAAEMEANALSGADRITLPFGARITLSLAGRDEDSAATGGLDVPDEVTISTPTAPVTAADRVSIDAAGIDRVLDVSADTQLVGL